MRTGILLLCCSWAWAETLSIRLSEPAEVLLEMQMSSPGSDFAQPGREAAVARISLPGRPPHYVTLFAGAEMHAYRVFLGELGPGEHHLTVERDKQHSAPGSGLKIGALRWRAVARGDPYYQVLAHAPVIYARADTLGRFSDVPLLAYCERLEEDGRVALQYTVIFSNEDGGTSTRALMARWGRTTDIEFVYRVRLSDGEQPERALIQTRDHKEVEFDGVREGLHPVLYVVTRNNMVAAEGPHTLRYQLAPNLIDLSEHSRELAMDQEPASYRAMTAELEREGKLRPFGSTDGEKISDPRNYLYLEMKVHNQDSALAVLVRLAGEDLWRSSNLGRADYAISRNGWVRTSIELPPGTSATDLSELGFQCLVMPTRVNGKDLWPDGGLCRLEAVGRIFFLHKDFRPGPDVWRGPADLGPVRIPAGQMRVFAVHK